MKGVSETLTQTNFYLILLFYLKFYIDQAGLNQVVVTLDHLDIDYRQ